MGSIEKTKLDWKNSLAIQRLLKSHMFKDAKVINVSLVVRKEYPTARSKKYAEVIYMLDKKTFRVELKLRDDRHWDTRRKNETTNEEGVKGSHFTSSDLLGEERVSYTT